MNESQLDLIQRKLKDHDNLIQILQDSIFRLDKNQHQQSVVIEDLSGQFGQVVRELGKVGEQVTSSRKEMLTALRNLSDHVVKLDATQKSFRDEWKGVCDARHEHVAYRLKDVERKSVEVLREVDDMSENSKVQYIHDLKAQLETYVEKEKEEKHEARIDVRTAKQETIRLIGIIVTSLLGGTGGTILIQWLLGG